MALREYSKYLEERAANAEAENAACKRRAEEAERWAKRQVDDNRTDMSSAQQEAALAINYATRVENQLAYVAHLATFIPREAVPLDDLLPASELPQQTATKGGTRTTAAKARARIKKEKQTESKRREVSARKADALAEQLTALEKQAAACLAEQGAAAWLKFGGREGGIS